MLKCDTLRPISSGLFIRIRSIVFMVVKLRTDSVIGLKFFYK